MAGFIGLVYGTLKSKGYDTKKMTTDEAVDKFNALKKGGEKDVKINEKNKSYKQMRDEYLSKIRDKYTEEVTENYNPIKQIQEVQQAYKNENNKNLKLRMQEYVNDLNHEEDITNDVLYASQLIGADLIGYDYRTKSAESFLRKIKEEPTEKNKDNVRYTVNFEKNPVEIYRNMVQKLEELGYKEIIVKNYWQRDTAYKGINTNFKSPEGIIFEIQYHDPKSAAAKEKMHKIYEIQRKTTKTKTPEWEKYENEMRKISNKLEKPKGIEKIKEKI